jgi:DNA-binding transcriptional LysR family regulator
MTIMLDDLNELRTFRTILATGSLSAAARDLRVGLGVVSKRLLSLERRAGVRLIHRTTRRLSPTAEGLALSQHVDHILEELANAEERLASGREAPHGLLRVTAPVSFGRIHLAPVLGELSSRYPSLSFELNLTDRVTDLVEERIDVAVRIGTPQDSRAVIRRLADNWRVLAASPDYLDRRGRPQHPSEATGHEFLRYDNSAAPWRLESAEGDVFELEARCRLRADSGDAVHTWALAGYGVMLRSLIDVAPDLAAGRLERVLPRWSSGSAPVYALFPSKHQLPLKTRVLLDALAARLSDPSPPQLLR